MRTSTIAITSRRTAARITVILASIGISLAAAIPSAAQSLNDIENRLYKQEQFFQPVNTPAPGFALQDADGKRWDLDSLKGKVVVLNFIYASCKDVCPLQTDLIAHIQEAVNQTPIRDRVQFISITTDPARDTPDVLKAYGPIHGLDPTNWTFLTIGQGQPENVTRELAERYGLKFTRTQDGEFVHGVVTSVIDRDGVLRAKFHGLTFDPTNLVGFVAFLANYVHKAGEVETIEVAPVASPNDLAAGHRLLAWMPIGLLVLAVAWLVGAITFFRFRRKRSATGAVEQQGARRGSSAPSAANDTHAASPR